MNRTLVLSLILTAALPLTVAAELKLHAVTDRPEALYSVGEVATFLITVTDDEEPVVNGAVKVALSKDGAQPQPQQTLTLKEGKASISGKLDEPGFLSLVARMEKASALATAGYQPEQLKPSMPVPDDFDDFWNTQKAKLAQVPVNFRMTFKTDNEMINKANLELFDVQVDSVDVPVSGYYIRPKNAPKRSLPAFLVLHGAGVRSAGIDPKWSQMEGGMLSMNINAHGLPNGEPAGFYEKAHKDRLLDYQTRGRTNREEIYFLGMFLRIIRAIDFLTVQPEWDGKTVILYGTSQGGFQAFAGAALDPRVTFFCAGVPAGCDHTGFVANRVSGWPKLVMMTPDGKYDPASTEAARYFDNVNFATRIKTRGAVVTVGFVDRICPPTGVYAAYNALTVPKQIHYDAQGGHPSTKGALQFMEEAVRKHIHEMKEAN